MNDERSLGRPKGMLVLVRADVLHRKRGRIGLVEDLCRICRKILGLMPQNLWAAEAPVGGRAWKGLRCWVEKIYSCRPWGSSVNLGVWP